MSLEEIEKLIHYSEKSGYSFNFRYTGGEPLYWKNLEEGTRLLRNSKICKSILLMTNGMKHENLTKEVISMLDYVRISQYGYNEEAMKILKGKYPHKVRIVDREEFYPNPKHPVENSTPVECGNLESLYFQGKVYACPHSYSLAIRHNLTHLDTG
jgi:organic radical activating enzyme